MSLCRFLPTPSDRMGILWSLLCVEDSVILEYGPAGTTHYSMGLFGDLGITVRNRLFSTHMSEDDVVMGDVSRLERALLEIDQNQQPKVIFVVASSVSAVIGTDLKGVCTYMQERVKARLIAFEQGGFRGDYSIGIREAYRLITDAFAAPCEKKTETYNIFGLSAGAYRAGSDAEEIKRLMREAFGMECGACLCWETNVAALEKMGEAKINLVLREEAAPSAAIVEKKCGVPSVKGAPYGYQGTLNWLEEISKVIGKPVNPRLVMKLKMRAMEMRSYRMYPMMLREDRIAVTIAGDYAAIQGLSGFMGELGFPVVSKVCTHSLRTVENPDEDIQYLPVERDRIKLMEGLEKQFVMADDVSKTLLPESNTYFRVSMPLVDGAQIATHLPLMGPRGADMILEGVEVYLQSLH